MMPHTTIESNGLFKNAKIKSFVVVTDLGWALYQIN